MGGRNEETICGLRMHINGSEVHIHDDGKSMKFVTDCENFKEKMKEGFEALKKADGIFPIDGDGACNFYLLKIGRNLTCFVMDSNSSKQKLETFTRSC